MANGITEPFDNQKELIFRTPFDKENRVHAFLKTNRVYTLWSLDEYIGYKRVYKNGIYPWKMYLKLKDTLSGECVFLNPSLLLDRLITAKENQIIEANGSINESFRRLINQHPFITQQEAIDFLALLINEKQIYASKGEAHEAQRESNDPIYTQSLINLDFVLNVEADLE